MKNYKYSVLLIGTFLICELCFFLPDVKAQNKGGDTLKSRITSNVLIGATFMPTQTTAIHFGESQEVEFTITWKDNKLEVLYGKETKPSEAVKQFFNWLKEYSERNYYIIKKDDLDKVLGKK